jgi:hypothetical protein
VRARGFGGVPLESRELMLASDVLRGGAAVLCKRCEADSFIGNRVIRPLVAQSPSEYPRRLSIRSSLYNGLLGDGACRARTGDLLLAKQALSQLS